MANETRRGARWWWPFPAVTAVTPHEPWVFTTTGYEWCEVCARNVYGDSAHELRHDALRPQNRAQRRALARTKTSRRGADSEPRRG